MRHVARRAARQSWEGLQAWLEVHGRFVAALALLTVLAGLPLFQFKEMSGHDSNAYLPRFVEFYQGLKGGAIFPRWSPDLAWGYGEPTFSFNPPLLYYLGSAFHALGFTVIASEDLSAFTLLLVAGLGMYLLASDFFGRHGGLVAATAYVYAPFVLVRLYVNHSLADFAAFAFMPFAFWGLHAAVERKSVAHWVAGTLGLAALILSSTSVTVIAAPPLVASLAWFAWRGRTIGGLVRGAWGVAVAFALAAFLWLPGLLEARFVNIQRREQRFDFHDHFLSLKQLIRSDWGYGLSPNGFSFELGPVHLLLLAATLLLLRQIWRTSPRAGAMLATFFVFGATSVFMVTSPSTFIWEHVSLLRPMQFPWRFLSFVALGSAFACGAPFVLLRADRENAARWLMVGLIAAIFLLNFRHANPQSFLPVTDDTYSPFNIESKGLPATERDLEPKDVLQFPQTPRPGPMTVLSGAANVAVTDSSPTEQTFFVSVQRGATLRMNTFWFPGWTLYVDGQQRPVDHSNPYGLMDFPLTSGGHTVRFVFLDTPVRTWSTRLSWLGVLLLVLTPAAEYALRRRRPARSEPTLKAAA